MHRLLTSLALVALMAAPLAMAKPITARSPAHSTASTVVDSCSLADLGGWASSCLGYVPGNDSLSALGSLAGGTSWNGLALSSLTQYKDDNPLAGSTTGLFDAWQSASDESRGQLSFLQDLAGPFVLVLKAGDNWAAYYRAGGAAAGSSISFDIPGVKGMGMSHTSIYAGPSPEPMPNSRLRQPSPVPEPGSLALVRGALGALAWRRRRSAQT